jgi:hypothetical protein
MIFEFSLKIKIINYILYTMNFVILFSVIRLFFVILYIHVAITCMCFWQIKNSFKGLHYPVKQNHQNYTYVNMYLCTEKIET